MITNPKIICDLFSFLDKDQIERVQLVNQFWNNVIIHHKNILPLRQFFRLNFYHNGIDFYATKKDFDNYYYGYRIVFDGTNLSKMEEDVSSQYLQLTEDEVLTNLNDVFFSMIEIGNFYPWVDELLNIMKLATAKTGDGFRGKFGNYNDGRFNSKVNEIFGKKYLHTARYQIHPN